MPDFGASTSRAHSAEATGSLAFCPTSFPQQQCSTWNTLPAREVFHVEHLSLQECSLQERWTTFHSSERVEAVGGILFHTVSPTDLLTWYLLSKVRPAWGLRADQKNAAGGQRNGDRFCPANIANELSCLGNLALANQQGKPATGFDEARRCRQRRLEALDRAQSYGFSVIGEVLGATGEYIDVGQCKTADDFAQKGRLLLIRFNQSDMDGRSPNLDGQAGKTRAAPDVEKAAFSRALRGDRMDRGKEMAGGKQGFAKMPGHNFLGLADGSQIHPGVPAKQ